ncbi:MAG: metal ABC transporter permease [Fimbriiglobus sp.]
MNLLDYVTDPVIRPTALGTAFLGMVSGGIGALAVVRRQALQGDVVSHAALPGLGIAFWLGARSDFALLLGAAVAGWLALVFVQILTRRGGATFDSALAGMLAVFFGLGLVVMVYLQRTSPGTGGMRLQHYLFGAEAATMLSEDLLPMLTLGVPVLLVMVLCWKELQLLCFDPDFAASLGLPTRRLDALFLVLIVLAVVMGLQTVGVVLMSAMIVAPGAAARQWTDRLGRMVLLAMLFGASAGVAGTFIAHALSERGRAVPTGPTIVLTITLIALGSLAFAPRRGILPKMWKARFA